MANFLAGQAWRNVLNQNVEFAPQQFACSVITHPGTKTKSPRFFAIR
jgi:hypothetical protein